MKKVSVVISARDEFPQVVMTVHAILNDLETFLKKEEFEIILVDNGSIDKRSWRYLAERGLFTYGHLKIIHDPIMGNVTARNKGTEVATGEYLFFSDAHMSYKIGSFKEMIRVIDETGGMVHPSVQWMGGYYPSQPSLQYTLKLGEKLWGTWNNYKVSDDWFYIPVSGHCCLGMKREQFLAFGGYNNHFRCYGGGELYLDLKWWMKGSSVAVVPSAVCYHLSAGRGYSYMMDDLIHNMMLLAYALGAPAFAERVYFRYMSKHGANFKVLTRLHEEALKESKLDKVDPLMSLYDVITHRPWDNKNKQLRGTSNSAVAIFNDTWLDELIPSMRELFDKSIHQRELQRKIETDWKHLVYQGKGE